MSEKKAILVVSFGTSHLESIETSIAAIENAIKKAVERKNADSFSASAEAWKVRRAFSSQKVIEILRQRSGVTIENVQEALERMAKEEIGTVIVQPTHLLEGKDYIKLQKRLESHKERFEKLILADPLLKRESDFDSVARVMEKEAAKYDDSATAVCFVGHGVESEANKAYANNVYIELQRNLQQKGTQNIYIGTLKANPTKEDILAVLAKENKYTKVVLLPLMIVAGAHAWEEMAGENEDTWKMAFLQAGYEVECVMKGLGEYPEVQEIFAEHVENAWKALL